MRTIEVSANVKDDTGGASTFVGFKWNIENWQWEKATVTDLRNFIFAHIQLEHRPDLTRYKKVEDIGELFDSMFAAQDSKPLNDKTLVKELLASNEANSMPFKRGLAMFAGMQKAMAADRLVICNRPPAEAVAEKNVSRKRQAEQSTSSQPVAKQAKSVDTDNNSSDEVAHKLSV